MRVFFYNTKRYLRLFIQSKPLALIVGPLVTGYFAVLDVWGDKWKIISDYRDIHELVFILLLLLSVISWVIRASFKDEVDNEMRMALDTINDFILHVGTIVEKKINRFISKIPLLGNADDKFSLITLPVDQLDVILQETINFLMNTFKLKEDCVDLCIVEKKEDGWKILKKWQRWSYKFELFKGHLESLSEGEPFFFPSKQKAVKDEMIEWTNRDKKRMKGYGWLKKYDGSLYIFPMVVQVNSDDKKEYLVSISTYEKRLCEEYDKQTIDVTKSFLREFCRRIEVELSLYTLKELKK